MEPIMMEWSKYLETQPLYFTQHPPGTPPVMSPTWWEIQKRANNFITNQDWITGRRHCSAIAWRRTLFNNQHKHLYRPDQERQAWAMEDYCWDCKQEYGMDREEDLLHALWTWPAKSDVRSKVLRNLLIVPPTQPVPTHLIWGKFGHMCIDNKRVNTLSIFCFTM